MAVMLPRSKTLGQVILENMANIDNNIFNSQRIKQGEAAEERRNQLFPLQLEKAQMENELFKPSKQAENNYKIANTNKLNFQNSNPLYGQPGVAGQFGAAELLKKHPELSSDPEAANVLRKSIRLGEESRVAQTDLQRKQAAGYDFNSLPIGSKEYELAQLAGMGIPPDEGRRLLTSGKGIKDIATENGYDPENMPEPVYPLTKAGQTALKNRQAANEEIKSLSKKISDSTKGYSRKIFGQSPKLILEALQGKNEDGQARALAARALQPELTTIRIRMGGGNVGIEAIREMTDKSMGHLGIVEALVSPEVYQKSQEYVDEWLTDAVKAANKKATQGVAPKKGNEPTEAKQEIEKEAENFKNEMLIMKGPDGKTYKVPQGKAQKFIDNGYKRVG